MEEHLGPTTHNVISSTSGIDARLGNIERRIAALEERSKSEIFRTSLGDAELLAASSDDERLRALENRPASSLFDERLAAIESQLPSKMELARLRNLDAVTSAVSAAKIDEKLKAMEDRLSKGVDAHTHHVLVVDKRLATMRDQILDVVMSSIEVRMSILETPAEAAHAREVVKKRLKRGSKDMGTASLEDRHSMVSIEEGQHASSQHSQETVASTMISWFRNPFSEAQAHDRSAVERGSTSSGSEVPEDRLPVFSKSRV
eukprot:TRINITY_DN10682_c0_g2_i3.p1 TRINITY_DN10682_c0_g2~~TRINITY_DN10682_c0_g2_i3.p1  ORF type:complete len:260 (+),score=47.10 TRINITY_DN10682_c0_g2_i3:535-1314(+)